MEFRKTLIMSAIREVIRTKMKEKGLAAHALEKRAGLKQSTLQNILYDKSRNPGVYIIQAIAKALDCSVSELLEEEGFSPLASNEKKDDLLDHERYPWKPLLYYHCMETMGKTLSKKSFDHLTPEETHGLIKELYLYTSKTQSPKPDPHFAEWLIEKVQERKEEA